MIHDFCIIFISSLFKVGVNGGCFEALVLFVFVFVNGNKFNVPLVGFTSPLLQMLFFSRTLLLDGFLVVLLLEFLEPTNDFDSNLDFCK